MLRHFALAGARWRLAVVGTVIILQPELARGTSEPGSRGPDARLACQAPAELRENAIGGAACAGIAPVRRLRGDLYAEANGWGRVSGEEQSTGLVPSVRVRAIWRLMSELDAHAYLFVKATRDRASATFSGLRRIHEDNRLLFGPGLMLQLWRGRVGLFAQGGPAVILNGRRRRSLLDLRAGADLHLEHPRCVTGWADGVSLTFVPCATADAEITWFSRFDHDVTGQARGRAGAAWLITWRVAWEALVEARGGVDSNGEYANNFGEVGTGLRWRLLAPLRVDLLATVNGGSYLGRSRHGPAARPLTYTDVRVRASAYLEL